MKNLIYLSVILLTLGIFPSNANSGTSAEKQLPEAPMQKLAGFKKDISTAD